MSSVHRRKSSKEESDDSLVENQDIAKVFPNPSLAVPTLITPPSPSRNRVFSSPNGNLPPLGPGIPSRNKPPPAPLGAGIPARRPPSVSLNTPPTSPLRTSFTAGHTHAHSRTRSISSGPFVTSSLPSPLQSSFQPLHVPLFPFPTSNTSPDGTDTSPTDARVPPPGHTRRHSRLHSRNLSIFFPRPHATISEVERPEDEEAPAPPPEHLLIPTAQSEPILAPGRGRGELDSSFTFGGIPKSESLPDGIEASGLGQGVKTRRGHHHKHSVSHNFFSFLEPGRVDVPPAVPTKPEDLRTTPTPTPLSPWTPISNASLFSSSNLSVPELIPRSSSKSPGASSSLSDPLSTTGPTGPSGLDVGLSRSGGAAAVTAILQFILGAFLWARGQSIGSLACTGLGYWVVFDAVGIAGPVLISYHAHESGGGMYGPARRGTMLLFAQCVYLMFSGIYVAKEAIEHILLAAGNGAHGHGHGGPRVNEGDGHHHHWGDERPETLGLRFPVFLIFLVLLSLVGTSAVFQQHNVLANITNKRIPSPADLFRHHRHALNSIQLEPTSAVKRFIQNPYTLPPILFCVAILGVELVLDVSHYAPFDLGLAVVQMVITVYVAYAACVVLGGVLLQTAPPMVMLRPGAMRGSSKMEAFWRVVREIERHEHVIHLPAPHVWQVVPPGQPCSVERSREPHTYTNGYAHHDHDHSHPSHNHPEHDDDRTHRHQIHSSDTSPALIITLSPHVRKDLSDSDVLALTQWACARVHGAFGSASGLGSLGSMEGKGEIGEVEVTVGVVRG